MPFLGGKLNCMALDLPEGQNSLSGVGVCLFLCCFNCSSQKEKCLLLELLEDALIRRPQHVVDLGSLVHLVGSGKQRAQAEREALAERCAWIIGLADVAGR